MQQLPPWSWSMLEVFEQCPRRMFHKYLLKEKEPESDAQRLGNTVHKSLELALRDNKPLPGEFTAYEPMARSIVNKKGGDCKLYAEMKMGITNDFKPTNFFAERVWGRSAADVVLKNNTTAWI